MGVLELKLKTRRADIRFHVPLKKYVMKKKLIIISIALVAIASLGANKFVSGESPETTKATKVKLASAPIGGLVTDNK